MAIRYDRSRFSIVVYCDCGWSDLGITKEAAYSLAEDHETRVHPEETRIRNAAIQRKKYHDAHG
jgi:hypothetical protein